MKKRIVAALVLLLLGISIGAVSLSGVHQFFSFGVKRKANLPDVDDSPTLRNGGGYVLVGGQEGTWFTKSQYPALTRLDLSSNKTVSLSPVSGEGTVWSGGYNGSSWFITGWGSEGGEESPNPYFYSYNGSSGFNGTLSDPSTESEWAGGDIFATSANGSGWFVSGMGSGVLGKGQPTNHLSAGFVRGNSFLDLTSELPREMDGILYANSYNGSGWLVGGGYENRGVLFYYNGTAFEDLTGRISSAVETFHSVQSIAWNGKYWLVGGIGFLAIYNGSKFVDLTRELQAAIPLKTNSSKLNSINAIAWNGSSWLLGGGEPVAVNATFSYAWLAELSSSLSISGSSRDLPEYTNNSSSSVLSISYSNTSGDWIIGGYSRHSGLLLIDSKWGVVDLSNLVKGVMTYVDWVGST